MLCGAGARLAADPSGEVPIRCQPSTFLWEDRSHGEQGLFHIDNQGCHVVRMLDAKGDGRSTGLVQGHLEEEEEEETCEELSWPGAGVGPSPS